MTSRDCGDAVIIVTGSAAPAAERDKLLVTHSDERDRLDVNWQRRFRCSSEQELNALGPDALAPLLLSIQR